MRLTSYADLSGPPNGNTANIAIGQSVGKLHIPLHAFR
jgi:hypothetical protein